MPTSAKMLQLPNVTRESELTKRWKNWSQKSIKVKNRTKLWISIELQIGYACSLLISIIARSVFQQICFPFSPTIPFSQQQLSKETNWQQLMYQFNINQNWSAALTDVDKSPGRPLAEHLGLVGERHLDHPGDVAGRGLHPDGVAGDELAPDQHRAEYNLHGLPIVDWLPYEGGKFRNSKMDNFSLIFQTSLQIIGIFFYSNAEQG